MSVGLEQEASQKYTPQHGRGINIRSFLRQLSEKHIRFRDPGPPTRDSGLPLGFPLEPLKRGTLKKDDSLSRFSVRSFFL